jgi:hypothetical protein
MLKEAATSIAPSITTLFNMSLKSGKLPSEWKSAYITPVFKKGKRELVSNYRPISLTYLVIKTLEKLIATHISSFVEKHNLI